MDETFKISFSSAIPYPIPCSIPDEVLLSLCFWSSLDLVEWWLCNISCYTMNLRCWGMHCKADTALLKERTGKLGSWVVLWRILVKPYGWLFIVISKLALHVEKNLLESFFALPVLWGARLSQARLPSSSIRDSWWRCILFYIHKSRPELGQAELEWNTEIQAKL